jgi:hypothetical protein
MLLRVSPNPGSDQFTLDVPSIPSHMKIFDASGREVADHMILQRSQVIDMSNVSPGIYSGRVYGNDGVQLHFRWAKR